MTWLFRWIFGYVRFSFRGGFAENFLTECFFDGIQIRDVAADSDGFDACCNLRTYKKLHRYAFRHGGKVRVIKRKGLPFLLLPLKNRIGFFVGMLAFTVIVSFLSCFIWNVEIVGNEQISDTTMYAWLEDNNISPGVMWSSVSRDDVCWNMMSDFEEISWVHINKNGSTARVEINEVRTADKDGDEDKLKGINVFRKELQVVAYREQKDITVKGVKDYSRIHFFNADIPLYFNKKTGDISQESESWLTVKDTKLPIGITTTREQYLQSTARMLSDSELLELAQKKMTYSEESEFDGFEIINKTESHEMDADKCVLSASYIVRRKS